MRVLSLCVTSSLTFPHLLKPLLTIPLICSKVAVKSNLFLLWTPQLIKSGLFRFVEFFWPEPACGNMASQPIATVVATIESLQYFNFFKSFSQ